MIAATNPPRIRCARAVSGLPCSMDWLIVFFLLIFAFIAWAPEAVTQIALAGTWVLFLLFIVGEILYYSGRFLLSLL